VLVRATLLLLAVVSLGLGMAGGLARLTPLPVSISTLALHGPLMVSAFFGTLISLERAVALGRAWAYAAPLCAGLAGLLLALGLPREGFALMVAAAAVLFAASIAGWRRQPGVATATPAGGALAWLVGNLSLLAGFPAVPWWIAFLTLTIAGERLEASRAAPAMRVAFLVIASAVFAGPLMPRFLGVMLVLLALWLLAFGVERGALRQAGRPRYVTLCLLAGDLWLAAGGVLMALSIAYDAALHAVFVGFVFSMVFAHAPIPYSRALYLPLALLHASLAVRVLLSVQLGGWGNAAAIALFAVAAAFLVATRASSGRLTPTAPGR